MVMVWRRRSKDEPKEEEEEEEEEDKKKEEVARWWWWYILINTPPISEIMDSMRTCNDAKPVARVSRWPNLIGIRPTEQTSLSQPVHRGKTLDNAEQHILSEPRLGILCNSVRSQRHAGAGSKRSVHLPVHKRGFSPQTGFATTSSWNTASSPGAKVASTSDRKCLWRRYSATQCKVSALQLHT